MSMYLGPAYGESDNPVIKSCEEHFSELHMPVDVLLLSLSPMAVGHFVEMD